MTDHNNPPATLLGGLLERICREKGWEERLGLHEVFRFWDGVVGRDVARRAQPRVIRGTVLWVGVVDSVWMQQLHLQKLTLLEKINERLPRGKTLADIRFQLDTGIGRKRHSAQATTPVAPRRPVDPDQSSAFEKMISSIRDEELRKSLKTLWLRSQRRR